MTPFEKRQKLIACFDKLAADNAAYYKRWSDDCDARLAARLSLNNN